jgi:L-iditol 2-dehydrogenase
MREAGTGGTVKVAAILGERKAGLVQRPDPEPCDDFAVVKIHAAPMCTEYKSFASGNRSDRLGHEAAGEVVGLARRGRVEVGDHVVLMPQYPCGKCALCVSGDYIYCEQCVDVAKETGNPAGAATMAQYALKQDWLLVPIPDGVSYDHAAMACCGLGPTFGAMQLMAVDAFDTVLLTGLGPVGLGGVVNARYRGARVIGVEPGRYRAELARDLGAEAVLDPAGGSALERIRELTGGTGVDKALDCTGAAPARRLCIEATRRKGHVAFVGEGGDVTIHGSDDMIRKGLTLHGVWHYNLAEAPAAMKVVRESASQIDRLITHTFPLEGIQDAFDLQLAGECGKVVLHPWE